MLELLKKDQNSLLDSRDENIKQHQSDEKVKVSELKNLISSLGRPLPTSGSVNTFPKPSCRTFSETTDSDGESHKHILRKKKLKKKKR